MWETCFCFLGEDYVALWVGSLLLLILENSLLLPVLNENPATLKPAQEVLLSQKPKVFLFLWTPGPGFLPLAHQTFKSSALGLHQHYSLISNIKKTLLELFKKKQQKNLTWYFIFLYFRANCSLPFDLMCNVDCAQIIFINHPGVFIQVAVNLVKFRFSKHDHGA